MSAVRNVQVGHFADNYLVVPAETDEAAILVAKAILGTWLSPNAVLKVVRVRDYHETVGQHFRGPEGTYACVAYDWRTGFWMKDVKTGVDRDVSERALGRTYHRIYEVSS